MASVSSTSQSAPLPWYLLHHLWGSRISEVMSFVFSGSMFSIESSFGSIHYTTSATDGKAVLKSDWGLPRRQKKDGCVSRHGHQRRGFLRQGQSHIAHRWEHLLRRGTLCCACMFDANPVPASKRPRVSLHWENPAFRKRRTTNALAFGEDEIRTLGHRGNWSHRSDLNGRDHEGAGLQNPCNQPGYATVALKWWNRWELHPLKFCLQSRRLYYTQTTAPL